MTMERTDKQLVGDVLKMAVQERDERALAEGRRAEGAAAAMANAREVARLEETKGALEREVTTLLIDEANAERVERLRAEIEDLRQQLTELREKSDE